MPTAAVRIFNSPLSTKGDVFVYSTGDVRLAVGSNGQVLTADSTGTPGVKWATPSVTAAGLPSSAATILHADGTQTVYAASANTSAARGTALLAAKAAAVSTDCIYVGSGGTYAISAATNLLVNGVNYYIAPGATIQTVPGTVGLFDDSSLGANSAVTCVISGRGKITCANTTAGTRVGLVNITNASSNVSIECESLTMTGTSRVGNKVLINQTAGTLQIRANTLTSNYWAVWWDNGDTHIRCNTVTVPECLTSNVTATPTGKLWFEANYINAESVVTDIGSDTTARVWIVAKEIVGAITPNTARVYVLTEKLSAGLPVLMNGGILWLTAQKITSTSDGWIGIYGGTAYIDCLHYENVGIVSGGEFDAGSAAIYAEGGTLNLRGGIIDTQTAGDAIRTNGGTINLLGVWVNSDAAFKDLRNTSGTLTYNGATKFDQTKTVGTITFTGITASASWTGALSSTDWSTFNGKQAGDATLTALAAYNTNGVLTQTAADTFTGRTITGTSGTITVTNGDGVSGNPTLTISSSYVGQNTITTLGTIATGVWNGTAIGSAYGGTGFGAGSYTIGDILYASGISTLSKLGAVPSGSVLASAGTSTAPAWSTAPTISGANITSLSAANISAGTLAVARGGSGVTTFGGTNKLLYTSSTDTLAAITTANSAVLITDSGGAPSWGTTLPAVSGANLTSLAAGNISSGTLAVARGGTNLGSYTTGDILYASGATTLAGLADVATGSVVVSGGVGVAPAFSSVPTCSLASMTGTLNVARLAANQTLDRIVCTIDAGGAVLSTGLQRTRIVVPFGMTITRATLLANESGSVVIDVLKSTYANFPTTASICASAKPTLSTAQKSQDSTLTGWTTAVAAGDVIEFNVNSVTTVTGVTLVLEGNRT